MNRPGRAYLLIGRATFSAAGDFAAEVDRDTHATLVCEPTGGGVETYGDTFPVLLPSLGWNVYVAGRYHERKRGGATGGSRSLPTSVSSSPRTTTSPGATRSSRALQGLQR